MNRIYFKLFITIILTFSFESMALSSERQENVANLLCSEIFAGSKTFNYHEYFSKNFIEILPEKEFLSLVNEVIEAAGKCSIAKPIEIHNWSKFKLISESGDNVLISFSLNESNLINGFLIENVEILSSPMSTWENIEARIKSLEGHSSLSIVKFGQESPKREIYSKEIHPLGSTFKLYVLGSLVDQIEEGKITWEDTFPIREEWKSLPSGVMQDWESGKKVSIKEFATNMIEISDNTATDHLIHILGRSEVEKQLDILGNDYISKNTPFLTTAELFKLKWGAPLELSNSYLNETEMERRNILKNQVRLIPLDGLLNKFSMENPILIENLEWFGSTNSLCSAMKALKEKEMPEIMEILSKNIPFTEMGSDSHWNFVGFKGGSEPGVYAMTYLLQNQNGEWGCVSLAWYNQKKGLNMWVFYDLVKKILKFAENEI